MKPDVNGLSQLYNLFQLMLVPLLLKSCSDFPVCVLKTGWVDRRIDSCVSNPDADSGLTRPRSRLPSPLQRLNRDVLRNNPIRALEIRRPPRRILAHANEEGGLKTRQNP